jgi:hypothetical protein
MKKYIHESTNKCNKVTTSTEDELQQRQQQQQQQGMMKPIKISVTIRRFGQANISSRTQIHQ